MIKWGTGWSGVFATRDATGALSAATVGPVGTLYVDGVVNGAVVTITGANPYRWTVTLPTLTTVETVSMYITATVGGIATGAVVHEDVGSINSLDDLAKTSDILKISAISNALRGGLDLSLYRGDSWQQTINGMGDLTGATDIWFAVKADPDNLDSEAVFLISETTGLEVINGAVATTPGNGSITVVGAATAGVIQIDLDEVETAKLEPDKRFWDAQRLVTGTVTTPKAGRLSIIADIARAVT